MITFTENFQKNVVPLIKSYAKEYGNREVHKYFFEILTKTKELYQLNCKKDKGQSWRNESGAMLENLVVYVIGYDLNITRPDVIKNDSRKIPLEANSVDFVFIDSPYSDNIDYSDDERCIGKISCEKIEFYDELEKVASEIARILKPNKVMGWVIADQWIKKKFTAVGFLLWQRLEKYFQPMDIICLTRHNQTSNTGVWHNRARQFNFYLRGFKYLFIMKKQNL